MVIWANKPELHKQWVKEFSLWIWNLDVQEKVATAGGFLPVRKDFIDDEERASSLQQVSQAVMRYMDENNTKIENGFKTVPMSDPSKSQGGKVMDEAVTNIVLGKQDPKPILEEAEELYKIIHRSNKGMKMLLHGRFGIPKGLQPFKRGRASLLIW